MAIQIEIVSDLHAAWPEIEPLALGIIKYHEQFRLQPLRDDWSPRLRDYMAAQTDGITLLSRDEQGTAVGFLNGRVQRNYGIFAEITSFVDNAFVIETARSRGVGQAMLAHFEQWARANGASEVTLHVVAANQLGHGFWARAGFEIEMHVMRKEFARA